MLREKRIQILKGLGLSFLLVGLALACSPVSFKDKKLVPECAEGEVCVVATPTPVPGEPSFRTYSYTVPRPSVDILIVNDNTGSMRLEQQKMGQSFDNFLNNLDGIDWRIGMITMDISNTYRELNDLEAENTTNNPNEYYDGNLVRFSNGQNYITPSTPNYHSVFLDSIEMTVEGFGDERGIFTASLALEKQGPLGGNFLRNDAHLAIIFLTDENVRTNARSHGAYKIRHRDTKEYFFSQLNQLNNNTDTAKGVSVHSIIARNSDAFPSYNADAIALARRDGHDFRDLSCVEYQSYTSIGEGVDGDMYAELSSDPRSEGIIGSVCDEHYDQILSDMGRFVNDRAKKEITLPGSCFILQDDSQYPFELYVNGGLYSKDYYEIVGNRIVFTPAVSSDTAIFVTYYCAP